MGSRTVLVVALSLFLPAAALVALGVRAVLRDRVVLEREFDAEAERVAAQTAERAGALVAKAREAFMKRLAPFDGTAAAVAALRSRLGALRAEQDLVLGVFLCGPDRRLIEPAVRRFPPCPFPSAPEALERFLRLRRSLEILLSNERTASDSALALVEEASGWIDREVAKGALERGVSEMFRATLLLDLASHGRLTGDRASAASLLENIAERFPATRDLDGVPVEARARLLLADLALADGGEPEKAASHSLALLAALAEDRFELPPGLRAHLEGAAEGLLEKALASPALSEAQRLAMVSERRAVGVARDFLAFLEAQVLPELDGLPQEGNASEIVRIVGGRVRVALISRLASGYVAGFELAVERLLERIAPEVESLAAGANARIVIRGPGGSTPCTAGGTDGEPKVRERRPLADPLAALTIETALGGEAERTRRARYRWWTYGGAIALSAALLFGGLALTVRAVSQSVRLAQLRTDFVRNVSHELRTPLTAIRMYGEILLEGGLDKESEHEYFRVIVSESERLGRLVEQVLDFARLERGALKLERKPTDLAGLASEVVESVRHHVEPQGFDLRLRSADNLPLVKVDRDAIERILRNLLANAVNYSRDRKLVEVEVGARPGRLYVAITDHGIGIAPEDRRRLFTPFGRVSSGGEPRSGFGLGLVLALELAKLHGGAIDVESEPDRGSTFTLWLPVESEDARCRAS